MKENYKKENDRESQVVKYEFITENIPKKCKKFSFFEENLLGSFQNRFCLDYYAFE